MKIRVPRDPGLYTSENKIGHTVSLSTGFSVFNQRSADLPSPIFGEDGTLQTANFGFVSFFLIGFRLKWFKRPFG